MKESTFSVPSMYGDHHVLGVRQALLALEGVESVMASAGRKSVVVRHDDGVVSTEALSRALGEAGYPVETPVELEPTLQPSLDGSAWCAVIQRVTGTNRRDLELSGDFRRY
jgi:copper chaperone CopZ